MLNYSRDEEVKESLLNQDDLNRVNQNLIQPNTSIQQTDFED
jgi:hypothetical protein